MAGCCCSGARTILLDPKGCTLSVQSRPPRQNLHQASDTLHQPHLHIKIYILVFSVFCFVFYPCKQWTFFSSLASPFLVLLLRLFFTPSATLARLFESYSFYSTSSSSHPFFTTSSSSSGFLHPRSATEISFAILTRFSKSTNVRNTDSAYLGFRGNQ